MGLPYSKQINAAFDQVTPLVAAGFEVLQTTRNISLMLAVIQVLTVILLLFILLVLLGLLISINPNLSQERDDLVTPALKAICGGVQWMMGFGSMLGIVLGVLVVGALVGTGWGVWYTGRDPTLRIDDSDLEEELEKAEGADIEAIKKGESDQ